MILFGCSNHTPSESSKLPFCVIKMRNTIIDPPIGLIGVQTYNGFEYDESREALKIGIRQCSPLEAAFWAMEALRTNTECGRDTVKELLFCACLEVGPCNPSLIVIIDNMIGRDVMKIDYDDVIICVELLSVSPKCRLFAWMSDYYLNAIKSTCEEQDVRITLTYISIHLDDREFDKAVEESAKLLPLYYSLSGDVWKKLCATFSNPSRIKKLSTPATAIWIPILSKAEHCGSQKVCNLVHRIYNIACARPSNTKLCMRNDSRVYSMCIYAMWVLCNIKSVEDTWYEDGLMRLIPDVTIMSDVERLSTLNRHLNRKLVLSLPLHAINMFTCNGLKLNLGVTQFVTLCAKTRNSLAEYEQFEQMWLQKVITTQK